MKKFMILGASSEIALEYIKQENWSDEDVLLLQYNRGCDVLKDLQRRMKCETELLQCDFLSDESVERFCEIINEKGFVPTHILHASAIPISNRYFKEETWSNVKMQMEVQCGSLFRVLQQMLPQMTKKGGGKIVTILSSCVYGVPPKYLTSYVMTKYALMGMVKSLANEYASKKVQINAVSPTMIPTKFCDNVSRHVMEQSAAQNPMKRNAEVDDIIPVLRMLFSENNSFVTGANIPITGGEIY